MGMIQYITAWLIPDISAKLLKRQKREGFLLREHIIEYEKKTAMEKAAEQNQMRENYTSNNEPYKPVDATGLAENGAEADLLRKRSILKNSSQSTTAV